MLTFLFFVWGDVHGYITQKDERNIESDFYLFIFPVFMTTKLAIHMQESTEDAYSS